MLALLIAQPAVGLQPPRPGEIAQLKQTGEFAQRRAQAEALGNHRIDADRLDHAIAKARRQALIQQGANPELLGAPPPARALAPTTGNLKIFALLIDFDDYPGSSTPAEAHSALFGDGSLIPANVYPYESVSNFYERASYNQLHLSGGTTLGWYHAPYDRSAVVETNEGREAVIKDALTSFNGSVDFSQFDNDGNGQIDFFLVIWTGPNTGWSSFWWAYQTGWTDPGYTLDGKQLGKYVWQWEGNYGDPGKLSVGVAVHETGHALGLPDYYDYNADVGPDGGLGGLDMMDGNWGDHNSFSKWVLDWITPTVVASGSQTVTLDPSGTSHDAVVIMPDASSSDSAREFFVAQNRQRVGNDPLVDAWPVSGKYPTDGMLVWHVDARLNSSGSDWAYDNSFADHKLLKLMQADGLDRIENFSVLADTAMYYTPGKTLGPLTNPSSRDYLGVDSGVNITNISRSGQQLTATFSIDEPRVLPLLTVSKAGNGSGSISSDDGMIACGSDCAQSYASPFPAVTLTAVAAPGSDFAGWSGGGCSGTGPCVVSTTADAVVT
ncbi:MAG TPA: M6 family metalloprotease domain-containing protein, partial [Terriglobales bacterium]|nr:M6 family metalloprotease domain-containing protein [Terriglobales bacterium]